MTQRAGICVLMALLFGACGVGEDGDDGDDSPPGTPIPIDHNPDKIVCSGAFTVTGSYTAADPVRPIDKEGCWPVGTWTFTVQIDNNAAVPDITGDGQGERCGVVAGTAAPTILSSYSFKVNREDPNGEGWIESYQILSDTASFSLAKASVNAAGNAECEGHLEMYSADKKQFWNMRPTLSQAVQTATTLTGIGEYTLFIDAQQ